MINLRKSWDKNFIEITQNNALTQGKVKKSSKIVKKVIGITDELKENMLKLHYKYWELKHKIKFLNFRLEFIMSKGDDFSKELVRILFAIFVILINSIYIGKK